MSTLHSVYQKPRGVGIDEPCVQRIDGSFIGCKTGKAYPAATHYSRPRLLARINLTYRPDLTGIVHLADDEANAKRSRFEGCIVAVEEAHNYGKHKVYFSPDIKDYFADCEITLLK